VESPFEILGIDSDADAEEIENAYRRRVKEAHPDHGGSAREFQLVYAAYRELRSGYDGPAIEGGVGASDERGDSNGDSDGASDAERGADDPEAEGSRDDPREKSRVEYLNYEVLDDYGWDLGDDDLFEKASAADLDQADYGRILVEPRESLLEAAENRGFAWPYACRGGACANCAVAVVDGEMEMSSNHILPPELVDEGIRLSCINAPITEEMRVVYNVKHLPSLDELKLPPYRFERTHASD
jgi:curved DNA-binding protein CbpA